MQSVPWWVMIHFLSLEKHSCDIKTFPVLKLPVQSLNVSHTDHVLQVWHKQIQVGTCVPPVKNGCKNKCCICMLTVSACALRSRPPAGSVKLWTGIQVDRKRGGISTRLTVISLNIKLCHPTAASVRVHHFLATARGGKIHLAVRSWLTHATGKRLINEVLL